MSSVEYSPKGDGPSERDMAQYATMLARECCQAYKPDIRSGAYPDQSWREAL
ncbi:hypothetical protein PLA106_00005, partial [Pseudomonas amygdali pv. lachrymans str. M302278]